mgnify:FL=1
MAIIAKLIVERAEKPIDNEPFFGEVKRSQKTEETTEFEKVENVTLPNFDKVQIVFNKEECYYFNKGEYSYRVTIDKHLFEYNDNYFYCYFSNTEGNVFELDIFNDKVILKEYYSRSEFDEDEDFSVIEDVIVRYDDDVKES